MGPGEFGLAPALMSSATCELEAGARPRHDPRRISEHVMDAFITMQGECAEPIPHTNSLVESRNRRPRDMPHSHKAHRRCTRSRPSAGGATCTPRHRNPAHGSPPTPSPTNRSNGSTNRHDNTRPKARHAPSAHRRTGAPASIGTKFHTPNQIPQCHRLETRFLAYNPGNAHEQGDRKGGDD